ncbi:MAG TPA: zf-HC2 domain-containing protein [Gaiellaceae bacterium]|nr:zf-HC2 domain-containing protein [Gaiellaceae bacterium]
MSFSSADCPRARESVSAQLDRELPELELDRLENHLRVCPECSTWAEQVRDLTVRLREAALEVPAEGFGFVRPRRSRSWAVSSAVALASAAAVVATIFVAPARQHTSLGPLGSFDAAQPRSTRYDVPLTSPYPHPLDLLIPGASSVVTAQWPVRPL